VEADHGIAAIENVLRSGGTRQFFRGGGKRALRAVECHDAGEGTGTADIFETSALRAIIEMAHEQFSTRQPWRLSESTDPARRLLSATF
jgi:hypothetical protein